MSEYSVSCGSGKRFVLAALICFAAFILVSNALVEPVMAGAPLHPTRITRNRDTDLYPQIDAGKVVWEGYDGSDWEIFLYNGTTTTQITSNSYNDYSPQIDAGKIVWYGDSPDYEIFLYDGGTTTQITKIAMTIPILRSMLEK